MTGGPRQHLFQRVTDALDYLLTLARLRILDAMHGPERPRSSRRAATGSRQPSTYPHGEETPKEGNGEPAAQRTER